jgi:hypothetical protein
MEKFMLLRGMSLAEIAKLKLVDTTWTGKKGDTMEGLAIDLGDKKVFQFVDKKTGELTWSISRAIKAEKK